MKLAFISFGLLLLISTWVSDCKNSNENPKGVTDTVYITKVDTVFVNVVKIDTIFEQCNTTKLLTDLQLKDDSLLVERYKVGRVRYYTKLAQKNPSQLKFLVGWILRAIAD